MVELLMLGIIPGTNIQINFTSWLIGTAILSTIVSLYIGHRKHVAHQLMIFLAMRRAIHRVRLGNPLATGIHHTA